MKRILFISALIWLMSSCEKSEIIDFASDDSAVYFQGSGGYSTPADGSVIYSTTYSYVDSSIYSFVGATNDVKTLVVSVPILTMGKVKDYKRPVKITIDEERTTAVRGVNFEVNLDTVAIPANTGKGWLQVTLFRTDDLLTKSKRVAFRLEENENFQLHISSYKASSNWLATADTLSALNYAVVFHEQYTEPIYYAIFGERYWGKWTPKKYQVLNDVMGWTDSDWQNPGNKIVLGRFDFAAKATQRYLQEMADGGTPVIDSDGSYMQLVPKYAVDYSKYEDKE